MLEAAWEKRRREKKKKPQLDLIVPFFSGLKKKKNQKTGRETITRCYALKAAPLQATYNEFTRPRLEKPVVSSIVRVFVFRDVVLARFVVPFFFLICRYCCEFVNSFKGMPTLTHANTHARTISSKRSRSIKRGLISKERKQKTVRSIRFRLSACVAVSPLLLRLRRRTVLAHWLTSHRAAKVHAKGLLHLHDHAFFRHRLAVLVLRHD